MRMETEKFVVVDDVRTRYFEAGDGDPLVLIHGGDFDYRSAPSAIDWQVNYASLAKNNHVYAFDKLGCGQTDSPLRDTDYTMRTVWEHAAGFLRSQDLRHVTLWGHSRGALVALRLAIEYPDLIRRLVITNSNSCCLEDPAAPKDIYTRAYRRWNDAGTEDTVRDTLELISFDKENSHLQDLIRAKCEELGSAHPDRPMSVGAIEKMWNLRTRVFMPDALDAKYETLDLIRRGKLQLPIAVIWGFNDPTCPMRVGVDFFQWLALRTPAAEFHVVNNAGHQPHVEKPLLVESIVASFFTSTARGGVSVNKGMTG